MAQTGYTPILIYSSSTAAAAPAAGSLTNSTLGSELAINITDGKLFYKDNANAIQVIGWKVVPATAGGTGQTSYAVGDILYADTTTSLAKLADVATGNALISGGVGVAPSWGKIGLTTHVSGTLPVANGGTGLASYTANRILYASGTTTIATSAGLTFDGTNFATTGSATATAFIPSSSTVPSNGLYLPAANTVGFSTNTIERLRIDSSGDLRSPGKIFIEQVHGYGTNDLVVMSNNASKGIVFYTGVGGVSAVERGQFDVSGNLKIKNGNLVIETSGKGIDFSATPGTGTSELFADYEEGTWTPTLITTGTNFTSVTYNAVTSGRYTKIGNVVHFQFRLLTTAVTVGSASGNVQIGGLPFTAIASTSGTDNGFSAISLGTVTSWAGEQPSVGAVFGNTTKIDLSYRTTADGATILLTVADVGTGAVNNNIYAAGTYIAA